MNPALTETREQERIRLLTDLHASTALLKAACRAQEWSAMAAYARECSRLAELLELNREERE